MALSSIKSKDDGIVDFDLDGPQSKTLERLPILCIPVPGESGWAGAYFGDNSNNTFDDSSIEKVETMAGKGMNQIQKIL